MPEDWKLHAIVLHCSRILDLKKMVPEVGLHPISLDKEQHVLVGLFSEYKKIVSEDKELRRCD